MTMRQKISKRMRVPFVLMLVGLAIVAVGFVAAAPGGQPELMVVLPGFALFIGASVWLHLFALRCTACFGNCGPVIMQQLSWMKVSEAVKFCPFCGISLDTSLEPTEETQERFE